MFYGDNKSLLWLEATRKVVHVDSAVKFNKGNILYCYKIPVKNLS